MSKKNNSSSEILSDILLVAIPAAVMAVISFFAVTKYYSKETFNNDSIQVSETVGYGDSGLSGDTLWVDNCEND